MLTRERLQDIFHSNTDPIDGQIVLHHEKFDSVYDLILESNDNELKEVEDYLKSREKDNGHHYSTSSLIKRLQYYISDIERLSTVAIVEKKRLIEDALVYFRSVVMITESIGMAGTHAEKGARLRGLIELLNSAITKLRNEQENNLLSNWESFSWSYSDYPYRKVLEEYNNLKRRNEEMRKIIEKNNLPDELPF